jgi:hypothetical protein
MEEKMKKLFYSVISVIMLSLLAVSSAYPQPSKEVSKTVDLANDGRVDIDTYKGSITIETWDQNKVEIYAKIEADGRGRDDRDKVEDTQIRIHEASNRVEIVTEYGKSRHHGFSLFGLFGGDDGNLPYVHYSIKMPATARLKIKDYKSETTISDLLSSLRMETYKGTVLIKGQSGSVDLETYKGDVRIDFAKYPDDCRFETYKGRIQIELPRGTGFEIRADLGKKSDFQCDFNLDSKRRSRKDDYIKANVNGGGPELAINTSKGDIRLIEK